MRIFAGISKIVMKVLFVCNNAYNPGNGLSTSVKNTMAALRRHGVDARLMAVRNPDPDGPQPDFPLEHFKFPLLEPIIYANGFCFARNDRKRIDEAVRWADIVHFEEALPLEYTVCKVARKLGKACTATYHLYPHNIAANLGLGRHNLLNGPLMRLWMRIVFDHCSDIQCPTQEVERYLRRFRPRARLHVISNGILLPEEPVRAASVSPEAPVNILCIGRLAAEKSQETLLEAVRYSRYADRIRLIFGGNGPKGKRYRKIAGRLHAQGVLKIAPVFGFYSHEQIAELVRGSYLYIHCAWVEVEGLSCLEAMREGIVPVIAEGELIGTSAFALCPESLYPVRDSRALAARIDWWIEHPRERDAMAQRYADAARNYGIDRSVEALIAMYRQSLASSAR